jgi:hypothetical protein
MSTAVISMIIVDITPEDSRYYNQSPTNKYFGKLLMFNRIICFYSIGAAVTIANLLAFPLGSWLLPQDMWLQYIVSFCVLFAAFLIAFVIPETRKIKQRTENSIHATDHGHQVILQVLLCRTSLIPFRTSMNGSQIYSSRQRRISLALAVIITFSFALELSASTPLAVPH